MKKLIAMSLTLVAMLCSSVAFGGESYEVNKKADGSVEWPFAL